MSNHYNLGKAYGMEDNESVLSVKQFESRIEDIIVPDRRYVRMMHSLDEIDKANLFGHVLHAFSWIIEQSDMFKDMVEEILEDYHDAWYDEMQKGGEDGE